MGWMRHDRQLPNPLAAVPGCGWSRRRRAAGPNIGAQARVSRHFLFGTAAGSVLADNSMAAPDQRSPAGLTSDCATSSPCESDPARVSSASLSHAWLRRFRRPGGYLLAAETPDAPRKLGTAYEPVVAGRVVPASRLGVAARLGLGLVGAVLCVPLGVASQLEPSPLGMGTHQQLGLPPCTFRLLLGMRCPTCGMTTSWAHMVRGQMASALRVSVTGTALALLCAAGAVCALASALSGKLMLAPPRDAVWICGISILLVAILCEWVLRLAAA